MRKNSADPTHLPHTEGNNLDSQIMRLGYKFKYSKIIFPCLCPGDVLYNIGFRLSAFLEDLLQFIPGRGALTYVPGNDNTGPFSSVKNLLPPFERQIQLYIDKACSFLDSSDNIFCMNLVI